MLWKLHLSFEYEREYLDVKCDAKNALLFKLKQTKN